MSLKKPITIIGGGPAALMLGCELDPDKYQVSIYEQNTALGRKFLVAGKGGFNLTHSETIETMLTKYSPETFLKPALLHFTNEDLRTWLKNKGIETYVGSSKRVFPVEGIKPIEVLNAFEKELKHKNVSIHTQHTWKGWDKNNDLIFETKNETKIVKTDIVVFALGGGSWKVTGSNGAWLNLFEEKGIQSDTLIPSNCAYKVDWNQELKAAEGAALKNCAFSCNGISIKGEAVITKFGIEGGVIYALSNAIRKTLLKKKKTLLEIDFKPSLELSQVAKHLSEKGKLSIKDVLLEKLNLSLAQITLLKNKTNKEEYQNPAILSELIKKFPVVLTDLAPIDEAISTVGGINLKEVDKNYELKKLPLQYCLGEMLNWDAPTGGYLLQGCFSMGNYLAGYLNAK